MGTSVSPCLSAFFAARRISSVMAVMPVLFATNRAPVCISPNKPTSLLPRRRPSEM